MNKGEAIELMQEELGVRGQGTTYPPSYLLKQLNRAQRAVVLRVTNLNPNLWANSVDYDVTAYDNEVDLNSQILRLLAVAHVENPSDNNSSVRPLQPLIETAVQNTIGAVSPSAVTHFSTLDGPTETYLRLWPIPDTAMTVRLHGVAYPTELSSDSDDLLSGLNPWLHDYVVYKALRLAVGRGRNTADIQWILQAEKEAWDDIVMNIQPSRLEPMLGATGYTV